MLSSSGAGGLEIVPCSLSWELSMKHDKTELEYRIPRLHSPVNSVDFRCRLFAPVDFRRKPEPVPRTQVLSYMSIPRSPTKPEQAWVALLV